MTNTITNPVTGEKVTFEERSRQSGGARTVGVLEAAPHGGVPKHTHDAHEERIEVLEGEIEVTVNGTRHVLSANEHIVIPKGATHSWRNPSPERVLKFRGTMTPGHPGFETALTVLFGLARDGQVRSNGIPRHFGDLALFVEWNKGVTGPALLAPLLRWMAKRARARGRATELCERYGCEDA
jgi:quercetin dioxygenase-like cupin family protein